MSLIDRYVYAVAERLPQETREDVSRELRANIEDMLPDDHTENEIRAVLGKLGNPAILAGDYADQKRYLIGPALYDSYFSVLKLVATILFIVSICGVLIDGVASLTMDAKMMQQGIRIFIDILASGFMAVAQAFLWVTLVFAIMERSGIEGGQAPFTKRKWSLDDLPDLTTAKKRRISRGETLFSMICNVLFTAMIYFFSQHLGMYQKGADGGLTLIAPLFVDERLQFYMLAILILAFLELTVHVWKFIARQWTFPLAVANAVSKVATGILLLIMVRDTTLFNPEFIAEMAKALNTAVTDAQILWAKGTQIFAVIFIFLICAGDALSAFIKLRK